MRDTLPSGVVGVVVLAACQLAGASDDDWSWVRHRPDRGFSLDFLVDGRTLDQYDAAGGRYVEARPGAEYELRITNPTSGRVAVALSVDGLNTIDARRTAPRDASQWVILPYQSISIRGWQVTSERARRFTFTTRRDSYAARLGDSGEAGVISAVIYRERTPFAIRSPRPYLESERAGGGSGERDAAEAPRAAARAESFGRDRYDRREDDAATGIGRSVPYEVRTVSMELEDRPAAELTVRYAYRAELLRLGIPLRFAPEPETPWRRGLSPPAEDRRFCPEP